MSDIFLSYVSSDRPRAESFSRVLTEAGWGVWWDRSILPGETFDEVIEDELNATSCVVVLWTTDSVGSRWVRTEAAEGRDRDILVPVMLDTVEIPLAFRRVQAADLTDWRPGEPHAEFDELLVAITNLAGDPAPVAPQTRADNKPESGDDPLIVGRDADSRDRHPDSDPTPIGREDDDYSSTPKRYRLLIAAVGAATILIAAVAILLMVSSGNQRDNGSASATTYDESVLASGPITYWPLADESAVMLLDIAGQHDLQPRDLDESGFVPTHVDGPHGIGGLDLDRSAMQRLDSTFNPKTVIGASSWSLEVWMNAQTARMDDPNTSATVIGGFLSIGEDRRWYLFVQQGRLCVGIGDSKAVCGTGPNVDDGDWHHVVVSYDTNNGEVILFQDANSVSLEENPWGTDEKLTNQNVAVGAMLDEATGDWQEHWSGELSRIAVYRYVLEPGVIQAHFQAVSE